MNLFARAVTPALALALLLSPVLAPPVQDAAAGLTPDPLEPISSYSPTQALGWWTEGGPLRQPVGTLAAAGVSYAFALLLETRSESRRGREDGGALGNARIKEGGEAVAASDTWDGSSEPKGRGYVYGFDRRRYLFEAETPHAIVVGQTGSGKTRFQIIETLDLLTYGADGWNVVVSDPKGELLELCGDALRDRGYDVLALDLQHPNRSDRFDVLADVARRAAAGDSDGAQQAAEDLAAELVPEPSGGRDHWTDSARGVLAAVCLLVATSPDCPDDARNMASVARTVDELTCSPGDDPAEPLKSVFRELPPGHPARGFASQLLGAGGSELRSIISTLKAHLRIFESSSMARLTSGPGMRPKDLLEGKSALFLRVMDEGSPYNAVFAVLFDQMYKAAVAEADLSGGRLPRQTAIIGDEWGNLPAVRCLPSLLSLGRSFGLHWYGAVQNIAQLNRYGERDGRRKILANCGVKIALKLGEAEDREYFTALVGKTTRHARGESTARSGQTLSFSEHADDVIRPWEWTTMAPSRDGAIVVKQAENGTSPKHAGAVRAPLRDATATPTREHFDLGSPDYERWRREQAQRRLDSRRASDGPPPTWAPRAEVEEDPWSGL